MERFDINKELKNLEEERAPSFKRGLSPSKVFPPYRSEITSSNASR